MARFWGSDVNRRWKLTSVFLALHGDVWFRRVRFVILHSWFATRTLPAVGRKSTQPTVQILDASSIPFRGGALRGWLGAPRTSTRAERHPFSFPRILLYFPLLALNQGWGSRRHRESLEGCRLPSYVRTVETEIRRYLELDQKGNIERMYKKVK